MDHQWFDALTRGMAAPGTRRSLMRGLTEIAMGGLAARPVPYQHLRTGTSGGGL